MGRRRAAVTAASSLVAAVYGVAWLKGRRDRYHRVGLIVPLAVLALAAPAQLIVGDWAARTVAEEQPTKLAAMEERRKSAASESGPRPVMPASMHEGAPSGRTVAASAFSDAAALPRSASRKP